MPLSHKLNAADIRQILRSRSSGKTYKAIAVLPSLRKMHLSIQAIRYHCVQAGINKPHAEKAA